MVNDIKTKPNRLNEVIQKINEMAEEARPLVKGGKRYTMVQDRVEALRAVFGDEISIVTTLVSYNADLPMGPTCIFSASIVDNMGRILATGHAKETWNSTKINTTSALENAETSAIGRALASFGVHGGEFASYNEVETVLQQEVRPVVSAPKPLAIEKPITTEEWDSFRKSIQRAVEQSHSVIELKELWSSNIGKLEKLKSYNEVLYRETFEQFQQAKYDIQEAPAPA